MYSPSYCNRENKTYRVIEEKNEIRRTYSNHIALNCFFDCDDCKRKFSTEKSVENVSFCFYFVLIQRTASNERVSSMERGLHQKRRASMKDEETSKIKAIFANEFRSKIIHFFYYYS